MDDRTCFMISTIHQRLRWRQHTHACASARYDISGACITRVQLCESIAIGRASSEVSVSRRTWHDRKYSNQPLWQVMLRISASIID